MFIYSGVRVSRFQRILRGVYVACFAGALLCALLALVLRPASAGEANPQEQVFRLVNEERIKRGIPPLAFSQDLEEAASVRVLEIAQRFSHTRPDGRPWKSIFQELKIGAACRGENLAYGQRTPEEVVAAWMESQGHRDNLLGNEYTQMAIAHARIGGVDYWSQLLILPEDG